MFAVGDSIEAQVEKVVFQGKGLIRHQGWVIFVDDVVPGDFVRVKICEKKKSYFIGTLEAIITPQSKLRVSSPRCPYFGRCGGCQLQHMTYEAQCSLKKEWVNGALSHGISMPSIIDLIPASHEWQYRRKVTMHFEWHKTGANAGVYTIGYVARDARTLLDVKVCPIFVHENDPIIADVRAFLSSIEGYPHLKGNVSILKTDGKNGQQQFLLRFLFEPHLPDYLKEKNRAELHLPDSWQTVWFESPPESVRIGEDETVVDAMGLKTFISPHIFLQNFPEESAKLYDYVVSLIPPHARVLDLYCGSGLLTQLIAKRAEFVLGIELNRKAIEFAKKSAALNHCNNVQFIAAAAEEVLKKAYEKSAFDVCVLNPPRVGLSEEVVQIISEKKPKELVYISCYPSTLARDIQRLQQHQYQVTRGQSYDMFPQTTHMETVVCLQPY
ncbi:MAG TPA: class I SAM-dependent RNA methyltransferase [Chlamydiales bacterium]|nr:class I SAM-dependent RNA methyltransferase [Chlamydiales bacterium]